MECNVNLSVRFMEIKEKILKEIDNVPEHHLKGLLNYILYLEQKSEKKSECFLLSESSLSKDWLRPEEDEA